jgi:hypothetical protein
MTHSTKRKASPPPFKPNQFVNVTITAIEQAAIKAANFDLPTMDESLNALFSDGYKLSLRYDERNDCFCAWLIGAVGSANVGLTLTGRGSTVSKSIKQLLYIHHVMLEKDWLEGGDIQRGVLDD